jgi:uncharacterized protein (TIGR02118 family)
MIRLTYTLRRKPGASREEFQDYWRRAHGPLVAKHSERLKLLRYVQVHTIDDPANARMAEERGGMEEPYDGVAELWWRSRDDLLATFDDAEARAASAELLEDEATFIDLPNSPLWLGYEYPQVNPSPENIVARERSPIVKLFYCLRHLEDQTEDEAQFYWRTHHGPVIRSITHHPGGSLRYIQVHRAEQQLESRLRTPRGTEVEPYTGHAELWMNRALPGGPPQLAPSGRSLAVDDESNFIDFSRSAMWIAKERVFVDQR